MSRASLFRRLFGSARPASKPIRRCRLAVESLEDRAVPALLLVNSLQDLAVDLTDPTVTLRDAIFAAETDASVSPGGPAGNGADAITFAPALLASGPQTINLSIKGDVDAIYGDSAFEITTPMTIQGPTGANGLTLAGPGGDFGDPTTMRLFLVSGTGNLTLDHLTLTGGRAEGTSQGGDGGAIYNTTGGTLAVTDSTIDGNRAVINGGGLKNHGTATLTRSTISNNEATNGNGGGIRNGGTLTVINSTVSGNAAGLSGGGIYNGATLTLTNSTVTANRASSSFGGAGLVCSGTENLFNSIVAGNFRGTGTTADDILNSVDTAFYNLIGTGTGNSGLTNGVNGNQVGVAVATVLDPTLSFNGGPTRTHALIAGANPAVNAGDNSRLPAGTGNDQRGFVRIIGGTVDIGAVERDSFAVPTNLVVDTLADENDGNFADHLSLREAIALAELDPDAQTITFAPALLASGPQTINLSIKGDFDATYGDSAFEITTPVTIQGPTGANGLTLAGPGGNLQGPTTMRLFLVSGTGNLTLDHLTLTGGRADGGGHRSVGGAIVNDTGGTLAVTDSTIDGNWASNGGGLVNLGTAVLTRSTISHNEATFGGGILNATGGTLTVTNSTVSGNAAGFSGGGITNDATLTLTNSTVTANRADNAGGGLHGAGTENLFNTIVAGNFVGTGTTASDINNFVDTAFNNLIGTIAGGGVTNGVNGNQVGVAVTTVLDPTLAFNGGPTRTHAVLAGSPAINAGDNSKVPVDVSTDQRGPGFARIVGGTVDIGAVEVQNSAPTVVVPGAQTAFEDVDQPISGISVGDPEGDSLSVTLSVSHGKLTLGTTTGLTVVGNGTGSVLLSGSTADLNAALAGLVYRSALNSSGADTLSIMASDGSLSANGSVAITVKSSAQQAADLQAQISALQAAGVLNKGQANSLSVKLNLKGNNGDVGKVESFLDHVNAFLQAGILTQAQADAMSGPGRILLLSVTRR